MTDRPVPAVRVMLHCALLGPDGDALPDGYVADECERCGAGVIRPAGIHLHGVPVAVACVPCAEDALAGRR